MDNEENAVVSEKMDENEEPGQENNQRDQSSLSNVTLDGTDDIKFENPLLTEITEYNIKWIKEFNAKVHSGEITLRGTDFDGDE